MVSLQLGNVKVLEEIIFHVLEPEVQQLGQSEPQILRLYKNNIKENIKFSYVENY